MGNLNDRSPLISSPVQAVVNPSTFVICDIAVTKMSHCSESRSLKKADLKKLLRHGLRKSSLGVEVNVYTEFT